VFFLLTKFRQKLKFQGKKKKERKRGDFGGLQLPEVRGVKKKIKNHRIHILAFHCVAKTIEG
jgi:ribosomal protein L44E